MFNHIVGLECPNHRFGCNCSKEVVFYRWNTGKRFVVEKGDKVCATLPVNSDSEYTVSYDQVVAQQGMTENDTFREIFPDYRIFCGDDNLLGVYPADMVEAIEEKWNTFGNYHADPVVVAAIAEKLDRDQWDDSDIADAMGDYIREVMEAHEKVVEPKSRKEMSTSE